MRYSFVLANAEKFLKIIFLGLTQIGFLTGAQASLPALSARARINADRLITLNLACLANLQARTLALRSDERF